MIRDWSGSYGLSDHVANLVLRQSQMMVRHLGVKGPAMIVLIGEQAWAALVREVSTAPPSPWRFDGRDLHVFDTPVIVAEIDPYAWRIVTAIEGLDGTIPQPPTRSHGTADPLR